MKLKAAAIIFFVFVSSWAYAESLKVQNPINGHLYQRFDSTMTWHEGKGYCETLGGYLVTITSQSEQDFVYSNLISTSPNSVWLGGTDESAEGTWTWVTGEEWNYSNWGGGEPNDAEGTEEYLECFSPLDPVAYGREGSWNDEAEANHGACGWGPDCSEAWWPRSTICEWEVQIEVPVAIDIKPGSFPNSISLHNNGRLPVAILTTGAFNVATVDAATVLFGATEGKAVPATFALEDVDEDGDTDLVLHFNTQDTGIVCGDTSATLTGKTIGGQAITGTDSINTVGCR